MEPHFDDDGHEQQPGVMPAGPLRFEAIGDDEALAVVKTYAERRWLELRRPPHGSLKYPYVVPGATYDDLWDWDSLFVACALPDDALDCVQGSLLNLLDAPGRRERPPKRAGVNGEFDYYLHPYPLRAQFAYIAARRMRDFGWIEPFREKLLTGLRWYEEQTRDREGFFCWQTLTGIDNNPSVYGRPLGTAAGVDLAAFHYREYRAFEKLAGVLGWPGQNEFKEKAERLKELVQTAYWDEMDRFFYDVDRNIDRAVFGRQAVTWQTHLKFRNGSGLYPLWGGMATREQAKELRDVIMDEAEFLAPCGIRSTTTPAAADRRTGKARSGG
jgi:putative isomerase